MIFAAFSRRWPYLWSPVNSDRAARFAWLRDLRSLGVTDAVVEGGIDKSVVLEFPPSPAKFADMCAAGSGLPDIGAAWEEAYAIAAGWKKPHQCSHPAIWHALSQVGDFRGIKTEVLHKRFERNYTKAREQALSGKGFSAIPQPLPAPQDVPHDFTSKECVSKRAEALAALDAMMGRRASA